MKRMTRQEFNSSMAQNPLWKLMQQQEQPEPEDEDDDYETHMRKETAQSNFV